MDKKLRSKILLVLVFLVSVLVLGIYFNVIQNEKEIDCSEPLIPFYLTEGEKMYASEIANKINGFALILNNDGTKSFIARTEINNCVSFSELIKVVLS